MYSKEISMEEKVLVISNQNSNVVESISYILQNSGISFDLCLAD